MILPPPGFAQPIPDPSWDQLTEHWKQARGSTHAVVGAFLQALAKENPGAAA